MATASDPYMVRFLNVRLVRNAFRSAIPLLIGFSYQYEGEACLIKTPVTRGREDAYDVRLRLKFSVFQM
jgi:hypothetical protein